LPLVDTDVIAQLRRIRAMPPTILNLARHGETAVNEMSLSKQQRMIEVLSDRTNWPAGKPDGILISADRPEQVRRPTGRQSALLDPGVGTPAINEMKESARARQ
jgi:hypothetical protein